MKGKLMSVDDADDSSIFAFSAASRRRCSASLSCAGMTLRLGDTVRIECRSCANPAEVDALLLLELVAQKVEETVVKILSSKEGVTVRSFDLENASSQLQDGHVKSACERLKISYPAGTCPRISQPL
jgi:hypothetical protein